MKSVAWPVSRPGAAKPKFFTTRRSGVPIGWTVSESPVGDDEAVLVAEPARDRRRDEEQDEARGG